MGLATTGKQNSADRVTVSGGKFRRSRKERGHFRRPPADGALRQLPAQILAKGKGATVAVAP